MTASSHGVLLLARELRYLELLALNLQELLLKLLNYSKVILLLLTRCHEGLLELLDLLLFPRQLSLGHLQVDLQDTLLTCHVLVHLMDLLKVLLQVLCLLLELEVIARYGVLQRLVGVLHLFQLELELDDLVDPVVEILLQLILDNVEFLLLVVQLLLDDALSDLLYIRLLLLQLIIQCGLQLLDLLLGDVVALL